MISNLFFWGKNDVYVVILLPRVGKDVISRFQFDYANQCSNSLSHDYHRHVYTEILRSITGL